MNSKHYESVSPSWMSSALANREHPWPQVVWGGCCEEVGGDGEQWAHVASACVGFKNFLDRLKVICCVQYAKHTSYGVHSIK